MEVGVACKLKCPTWIESERFGSKSTGSLRFGRIAKQGHKVQVTVSAHFPLQISSYPRGLVSFESKSLEVEPYLNEHSIYLIAKLHEHECAGLMGSGKTTVGKFLSLVLSYSFYDSDALIEQEVNGMSVAEIFKHHGESFFRKKEVKLSGDTRTEILQRFSSKKQLVVSTGGGAVVLDENWDYMQKKGIVVWLDVPLEALAWRIAAVGTHSRPLLHYEHGDPYKKALNRCLTFWNRGVKIMLKQMPGFPWKCSKISEIASKLGYRDVCDLTPTDIAIEALEQIEGYLKEEGGMAIAGL